MVGRPVTEGIASKTPIVAEGVGIGNGSSTGKLVPKLASGGEREERRVRERRRGMDGTEGVSSGSGLSKVKEEVAPRAIRRSANEGEMLGERPARFIIRRNVGVQRVNK